MYTLRSIKVCVIGNNAYIYVVTVYNSMEIGLPSPQAQRINTHMYIAFNELHLKFIL